MSISRRAVVLLVAVSLAAWLTRAAAAAPAAAPGAAPASARRLGLEELLLSGPYDDPALVEDFLEAASASKRQLASDDYGHMRFGKRQPPAAAPANAPLPVAPRFDDYGHFRFGKRRPQ